MPIVTPSIAARARWPALSVRAFKAGLAPLVVGLLLATGWILATSIDGWHHLVLTAVAAVLVWKTRLHLLLMIGAGAMAGAMGWI